jgi:gliding motility-associated lipoprotein GldH
MRKLVLALIFTGMITGSCNRGIFYEKHIDNERITWNRFDTKVFTFDITNVSATYDFYIAIRHHSEVPFNQVTLEFTMYTPSGGTRTIEHKIRLRDREGKLLGNGMGDLWDVEYPARMDFQFTEPGPCRVEISSTMSQADLPGIMQVGLIVKKGK